MPNSEADPGAEPSTPLDVLRRLNAAWLEGRPLDVAPFLHPRAVMVFPGFGGRAEGRDALVAGFADFCGSARVHAFEERDHQCDVASGTAVVSYAFEMVYEREGGRYRSTGRDLWVLAREEGRWLAVWRTMLELSEEPAA